MKGTLAPFGVMVFILLALAALPAAGQEARLLEDAAGVSVAFVWDGAAATPEEAVRSLIARQFKVLLPPGNPEMPARTFRIAVPPEGEVRWTVEETNYVIGSFIFLEGYVGRYLTGDLLVWGTIFAMTFFCIFCLTASAMTSACTRPNGRIGVCR